MRFNTSISILVLFTLLSIVIAFSFRRQPQELNFHHFADHLPFLGIPNFLNVISNIPFLITGFLGLQSVQSTTAPRQIKLIYTVLFWGIFFTGIGSAYYHLHPGNNTLVWDRIPMTIVFMAFFTATISALVSKKIAGILLLPLCLIGIYSVYHWHITELNGHGDLRLYGWVQFYPIISIPLIMILFSSPSLKPSAKNLKWIIIYYIIAKVFEHYDWQIFQLTKIVSGHMLKHLAAAMAAWNILLLFKNKYYLK
jgi:hypothetical protein